MELNVGEIIYLKKQHPCGSHTWEILRTGADLRIKCTECGRMVMVPRVKLEKSIKKILSHQADKT